MIISFSDMAAYYKELSDRLDQHRYLIILWAPVFLGAGMLHYFSLKSEPPLFFFAMIAVLAACGAYMIRARVILLIVAISLILSTSGVLLAAWRTSAVNAPMIERGLTARIAGEIETVTPLSKGSRLILRNVTIEGLAPDKTPQKIRLSTYQKSEDVPDKGHISLLARINPPPEPVYPGAYDFAFYAYFSQVGGVGYALSPITLHDKSEANDAGVLVMVKDAIESLRRSISHRIDQHLDGDEAAIASALIIGERQKISSGTLDQLRQSGLAHLLAISGMHLALVAGILFFSVRFFFSLWPRMALVYPIKKYAALAALIGSFIYLLITGMPISAERAFVMTGLILLSVIVDRMGMPLRSVAFAAIIILVMNPEAIISPSFQMSFAAATALIATFEHMTWRIHSWTRYSMGRKIMGYVISLLVSSLVAGFATAPFALYHFNTMSHYGVLANLLAIPITGFWIMPLAVLSVVMMPIGLESLPLLLMGWGIDCLVIVGRLVSELPYAYQVVGEVSVLSVSLVTLGGLLLCLLLGKMRRVGLGFIAVGILMMGFSRPLPDVIIDGEQDLYAFYDEGILYASSLRKGGYTRDIWSQRLGVNQVHSLEQMPTSRLRCDDAGCLYDGRLALVFEPQMLEASCVYAEKIINYTFQRTPCYSKELINGRDLHYQGTHVIDSKDWSMRTVGHERGKRPWVIGY